MSTAGLKVNWFDKETARLFATVKVSLRIE